MSDGNGDAPIVGYSNMPFSNLTGFFQLQSEESGHGPRLPIGAVDLLPVEILLDVIAGQQLRGEGVCKVKLQKVRRDSVEFVSSRP